MKIRKNRVFRWRQRASERFEAKEERQKPSHALSNSRKFCQFLNSFCFSLRNSCTEIEEFLTLAKCLICRKNCQSILEKDQKNRIRPINVVASLYSSNSFKLFSTASFHVLCQLVCHRLVSVWIRELKNCIVHYDVIIWNFSKSLWKTELSQIRDLIQNSGESK